MKVTVGNYRKDRLYPRVVKAVGAVLARGDVVAPVDVFIEMRVLDRRRLEDWRFGRVPHLERVVNTNLSRISRVLRILGFHAHDLGLDPSTTVYNRYGKGPKRRLRLWKTGDPGVEKAWSRHFVRRWKD